MKASKMALASAGSRGGVRNQILQKNKVYFLMSVFSEHFCFILILTFVVLVCGVYIH